MYEDLCVRWRKLCGTCLPGIAKIYKSEVSQEDSFGLPSTQPHVFGFFGSATRTNMNRRLGSNTRDYNSRSSGM